MGHTQFYRLYNVAYRQQRDFWSFSPKTTAVVVLASIARSKTLEDNNLYTLNMLVVKKW